MLEREMEEAVASYPDLFIEPRLTLVRRQIVINKRRPDILFKDGLNRHLIVELQRGKLDEDHLQRHIYYYFDYLTEYPNSHPRLMFIANLLVPQHKSFLEAHGYEYKEIPENEFKRRMGGYGFDAPCVDSDFGGEAVEDLTIVESSHLLEVIKGERMTLSYKMLLLNFMAESADELGRVPSQVMAQNFKKFFERRRRAGKPQENPKRLGFDTLADRNVAEWTNTIRNMPLAHLAEGLLLDEGSVIRWAPNVWSQWTPEFADKVKVITMMRLVEYFNRNAGGY